MKLYELTTATEKVNDLLLSGEIDEITARDTLESLVPATKEKSTNLAAVIMNHEAEIEAMRDAEKRIAARRISMGNKLTWLKDYLKENMERLGWEKLSCPEFEVALRKNPHKVVMDESVSLTDLPEDMVTTKITHSLDKKAIKLYLTSGGELDGVSLVQENRVVFK
tara:strand:+ start:3083 stop:3580 length:498 start_codon:yes stop_codon:yes gene_type:complete